MCVVCLFVFFSCPLIRIFFFSFFKKQDILMVNKQGQTRIAQYFVHQELEERIAMEGEIIRKCLSRSETQVCVCLVCCFDLLLL